MLVLQRFCDESIVILTPGGDVIEITVVDIKGEKCRLGVAANRDYVVHRREVAERLGLVNGKPTVRDNRQLA